MKPPRSTPTRHAVCATLLAALIASVAPVQAQQSASPVTLDRVQVTATRIAQDPWQVPASISVIVGDDYRSDTVGAGLSEKLSAVPGLVARNRQNFAQDEQISIRGFGSRSTFGIRGLRLFVDGVPATMPDGQGQVSHVNLASADRIEVLRGPFSALYGNAAGGVLQVFTARGTAPASFAASAALGSYNTWRAGVDARGAGDAFDYNLALSHFETDGYRRHSAARRESFNAKVGFALGDAVSLTLVGNAFSSPDTQDPLGLTAAQVRQDPRQAVASAFAFNTRKSVHQEQLGVVLDATLSSRNSVRVLAYGGGREVEQFLSIPVATQRNPLSSGGVVSLDGHYAGIDARWIFAGSLGGRPLEVVAGLSGDVQRQHRRGYENFVGDLLGVRGALRLDQQDRVADSDQYAQATWRPSDDWSLQAGVRHSRVRFRSRDRYVTVGNPDDSGSIAYSATTPVLGASFRIDDRLRLYAAYGEGFETPTFNELGYRADGGSGPNFALRPARTRSMEAGLKFAGSDDTRIEFALFRADTRDELAVATSAGGRTTFQNAGRARRDGAELSGSVPLAAGWRAQFAYTYLDAQFRDGFLTCVATPCAMANTAVAAGTRLPGAPRNAAYLAVRWGGTSGWQARFDAQSVGAVTVDNSGGPRADAYTVFGASTGYAWQSAQGEGRVFAGVANLFDRAYVGSVIVNETSGRSFEPAPGRSFLLGVEWRWRP